MCVSVTLRFSYPWNEKIEDENVLNAELRSLSEQSCEVDLYPINLKDIENEVIPISILNSLMLILAEE